MSNRDLCVTLHYEVELAARGLTLERKAKSLMRVALVVRLVLVILDLNEVAVHRRGIQVQADKRIDGCCLRYDFERLALLVLELYQIFVVLDNLVASVL